jgi:ABC-type phosphate transport system permease subunit
MAAANQPLQASSQPDQIAERRWGELIIEGVIRVAGISSIVIIGLIFLFLLREGCPPFSISRCASCLVRAGIPSRRCSGCCRCWSAR